MFERARRARSLARLELAIGFGAVGFLAALYLWAPNVSGPMVVTVGPLPFPTEVMITTGIGVAGILGGLLWMIRIYRADPEPDQHNWRYRSR